MYVIRGLSSLIVLIHFDMNTNVGPSYTSDRELEGMKKIPSRQYIILLKFRIGNMYAVYTYRVSFHSDKNTMEMALYLGN